MANVEIDGQKQPMQPVNDALDFKMLESIINSQASIDRVRALVKLLEINQIKMHIAGEEYDISNLELITEYSNKKMTEWMVKNETWRKSAQLVFHRKTIDEADTLVGFMDGQVMLKMVSHRRKRVTEYINGLRGMDANSEVIPQNTKRKKFLGMI